MLSVDRFTISAQDSAQQAAAVMQRYGHHQLDTEHLLLALLEQPQGEVRQLLEYLQVDGDALSAELDSILRARPPGDPVEIGPGKVSITPRIARLLELANEESGRMGEEKISASLIFLEIFDEQDTPAARLLQGAGLTHDNVSEAIRQMRG